MSDRPTEHDRELSRRFQRLLGKYSAGAMEQRDIAELDKLIDADHQTAAAHADRLIAAGRSQARRSL